ncbi:LacI family DNA-binding transcriptional regulator [Clostridium sp. YIM B02551]|uniref:LacI family DNA-binding transcriptional regulator n=1 Tax=Clostridium sp. YIM B02551 TaxID=2910679 RepID=UPI001EEA6837|nr:LacI family DNA-binding transcriptional regulator [Clostridium sp. YIM B02551]
MSVTIRDVAKKAGVSASTVSRVIANSPRISEDTKIRVQRVIKELDYHPNAIARSLAKSSTRTIGLVLPNEAEDLFKNPFFINAMTGINICAQKMGYYIMYSFSKNEEEEFELVKKFTSSNLVDGVILLIARANDRCIEYLKDMEFPFSVIGRPEDTSEVLWVDNDNFNAMYNVVSKLLQKGIKKIGFISGDKEWNVSKDRLNGYLQAHSVHGVQVNESLIVQRIKFNEEEGYDAMKLIAESEIPQVVVTTDDLFSFGALKYLNENNLKDVALVGFNNTPLAAYQNPPLASVDINAEKLGYYAAKLLLGSLNDSNLERNHYIIETNLIARESIKGIL